MNLELHTDRLIIKPLSLGDLDINIELFTDPEVGRYTGGTYTAEEIEADMPTVVKRGGGGCIGVWCVIDRHTSEKLGTGALLPMPVDEDDTNWDLVDGPNIPDCEIEVGYILKQSAWGKGYATEICMRLLKFAFEQTPLEELVASIDDGNHKSERVLSKCGLCSEGRRRAYGQQTLCFRITQEQWEAENRP